MTVLVLFLGGISAVLLYGLFLAIRVRISPLNKFPKAPATSFIFGNFLEIIREGPYIPHLRYASQYGGLVVYRTNATLKLLVCDAAALKRVLVTNVRNYIKTEDTLTILKPLLRNGVLTTEGAEHSRQRKYLNPAFHFANFERFTEIFEMYGRKFSETVLRDIDRDGGETVLNINQAMAGITLDIIGKAAFGFDFNAVVTKGEGPMYQAYNAIFETAGMSMWTALFTFAPIFRHIPTPEKRKVAKALELIRATVIDIIDAKKKQLESGPTAGEGYEEKEDLLDLILRHVEAQGDSQANESEIVDQVMTFMAAGHETTAVTLCWALLLVSQDPERQERLAAEVAGVDSMKYTDKSLCPYLDAVIHETLRLYPAAAITNRVSVDDDFFGDYFVPKGTQIFVVPGALHRLPEYWGEDADQFVPERFLPGGSAEETVRNPFVFMPFLQGERACIGRRFALSESITLLGILIKNFRFSPVENRSVRPRLLITLRPTPDLHLRVSRR